MSTVGGLGEFGLIDAVTTRFPQAGAVLVGPGDDAAVLRTGDGRVVATTDLLTEEQHFRRAWSSGYDVGRKAAAQNLADVAAMGAVPTALLVGLAAPPDLETAWVLELADGLRDESAPLGASVVGGDVTRADVITVAVTALGDLQGRQPVRRRGARVGDVVAVAGRLGWSAAGHAVLSRGLAGPRVLVEAHLRPRPPYSAGPAAADLGATAMIDVSDGLVQDLGHVAVASGVEIALDARVFDISAPLAEAGRALGADPVPWVLGGGEDHALAATFPPGRDLPGEWRVVGRVTEGEGVSVDGEPWAGAAGWAHFA
ncbi:MAG: thiamine-phosphate kinase [Carbonactinosporaceae bacterium]